MKEEMGGELCFVSLLLDLIWLVGSKRHLRAMGDMSECYVDILAIISVLH